MMVKPILAALLLAAPAAPVCAWGFVGHRIITENAATAAPAGLAVFFKAESRALSDASIEPDTILRDREGERESRRHYIDLDELSRPPFSDLPFDEDRARALYGDRRVDEAGTLPWRIGTVLGQLRDAFRRKDWEKVVSRAGWLSHYVADAYQPLHTTKNHDGQESCNTGIHIAFETDLIDISKAVYRAGTLPPSSYAPRVIREPRRFIFAEILAAYGMVDEILKADTEAIQAVRKERRDYYAELERLAGPVARRQMARATTTLIDFWHTAWVEAGRPELPPSLPVRPHPPRSKGGRP